MGVVVAAVEQITTSFTPDTFNSTLSGVESYGPDENLHVSILKANSTRGLCFWSCNYSAIS